MLIAALSAGCSPAWYRENADRQVYPIVKDRELKSLEYAPEVVAAATSSTVLAKRDFDVLPTTLIPPPQLPPIEPDVLMLKAVPLGPPAYELAPATQPADSDNPADPAADFSTGEDAVRRVTREQLVFGPPVAADDVLRLGLFDSLKFAVDHSRGYRDQMEQVYLTALDVTLQRHLFRPRAFANVSTTVNGSKDDNGYNAALTTVANAGVRQQLPYGGEVVASALVSFVNLLQGNLSNGESAQLALSATVPLLRGAGWVNLEPLVRQERALVYAVRDFELFRRNFAVSVASDYFSLLTRQQAIRNRFLRFRNAQDLLQRTEALFAAGRINALEVQRSITQLLDAENGLNETQAGYEGQLDNFKISIGLNVERPLEILPQQVTTADPDVTSEAAVIDLALRYRLDLQTTRDQVADARRLVGVQANQLLPDLNLVAGGNLGNRANSPASAIDSRAFNYNAGLQLDLPLDRLAERNAYRASLVNLQRAVRAVESLGERVKADVRSAIRGIRLARETLLIQQKNIETARQRLEFANELLIIGRSDDSRDVVEAQNALLSAQDSFEQARANLQIQILQFLRDTGTLRLDPAAGALGTAAKRDPAAAEVVPSMEYPPEGAPPPGRFDSAIEAIIAGDGPPPVLPAQPPATRPSTRN